VNGGSANERGATIAVVVNDAWVATVASGLGGWALMERRANLSGSVIGVAEILCAFRDFDSVVWRPSPPQRGAPDL
jgi:hypothetical protein